MKFESGVLVSGTVEKIVFEDFEGADYMVVTGEIDASKIGSYIDDGMNYFQHAIRAGADKIIGGSHDDYMDAGAGRDRVLGREGDDIIFGGAGRDKVTGGAGSDTFMFEGKMSFGGPDGHDVITDFDANGGGDQQDYLLLLDGGITDIRKDGKNTIIEIDEDYSITLLNVKPKEITVDDFVSI